MPCKDHRKTVQKTIASRCSHTMIFCFVQGSPSTAVTTEKPSAPVSGGDNKLELGQERAMSGNSSVYS